MTTIAVMRRPRLGSGSFKGMVLCEQELGVTLNERLSGTTMSASEETPSIVVRWGCTTPLPPQWSSVPVMNKASAISEVNNKLSFAVKASVLDGALPVLSSDTWREQGATVSAAMASLSSPTTRWVLRARHHAQGRRMYKVYPRSIERVLNKYSRPLADGWYMRPRITKTAEYRVYVVAGKVVAVARKTPGDATKTAWNVARGGRFDMLRWDDWPIDVCGVAINAFCMSTLDFGGVDIMVEEGTNAPHFIEINSAPSLPLTSTETATSRHMAMAKAFKWHAEHGLDRIGHTDGYQGWRAVIHPCVWDNHSRNAVTVAA